VIDVDKSITVLYLLTIVFVGAVGFLPSPTFALDVSARAINAHLVWNQGITGTGVRVAVMDTGIYGSLWNAR